MNNISQLEQLEALEEIIRQLEERQSSAHKTNYEINSRIMYLQALQNKIKTNDHINILKVKELISEQREKAKELISKQIEKELELLSNQREAIEVLSK